MEDGVSDQSVTLADSTHYNPHVGLMLNYVKSST